jgi:hypothetical protein
MSSSPNKPPPPSSHSERLLRAALKMTSVAQKHHQQKQSQTHSQTYTHTHNHSKPNTPNTNSNTKSSKSSSTKSKFTSGVILTFSSAPNTPEFLKRSRSASRMAGGGGSKESVKERWKSTGSNTTSLNNTVKDHPTITQLKTQPYHPNSAANSIKPDGTYTAASGARKTTFTIMPSIAPDSAELVEVCLILDHTHSLCFES